MSLSVLDTPVSPSSTSDASQFNPKPDAKANRLTAGVPSHSSHPTGTLNFHLGENKAGPIGGNHQQPAERHLHHHHHHHHHHAGHHQNAPATPKPVTQPGFMHPLQQWLNQWLGRPQAPLHTPGHSHAAPNNSCRPTPDYSTKSNDQLGQALLDNFKAFAGSRHSQTINIDAIADMAQRPLSGNREMNQNIQLAKELMRRPDVLSAFDRKAGTGAQDGRIDKQQLRKLLCDDNPLKYKTDKDVSREMLEHFNQLKSHVGGRDINIAGLEKLASEPLTDDAERNHLIQLAQTILERDEWLTTMDNLASKDADGRISKHALEILSR